MSQVYWIMCVIVTLKFQGISLHLGCSLIGWGGCFNPSEHRDTHGSFWDCCPFDKEKFSFGWYKPHFVFEFLESHKEPFFYYLCVLRHSFQGLAVLKPLRTPPHFPSPQFTHQSWWASPLPPVLSHPCNLHSWPPKGISSCAQIPESCRGPHFSLLRSLKKIIPKEPWPNSGRKGTDNRVHELILCLLLPLYRAHMGWGEQEPCTAQKSERAGSFSILRTQHRSVVYNSGSKGE